MTYFRPDDGYQHKTVVGFMAHVLGAECKNIIERFDRMRRKRNIFTYEVDGAIAPITIRPMEVWDSTYGNIDHLILGKLDRSVAVA